MANEVAEAIQLLELVGELALFLGKNVLALPGEVEKIVGNGIDIVESIKIKQVQFHMLAQFKSPDKYETMTLKDMETITGGDYRILRLPIEKGEPDYEEYAKKFCEAMKIRKIPYAVMPDINIGDGWMEIAINPQDADKLKNLLREFDWPQGKEAEDISFDEYYNNGNHRDFSAFQNEAVENATNLVNKEARKKGIYAITADEILWNSNPKLVEKGQKEGCLYVGVPGRGWVRDEKTGQSYPGEYLRIDHSDYKYINQNKTVAADLALTQGYMLYDSEGNPMETRSGKDISISWDDAMENRKKHMDANSQGKNTSKGKSQPREKFEDIWTKTREAETYQIPCKAENMLHEGDKAVFLHKLPGLEPGEFVAVNKQAVVAGQNGFTLNLSKNRKYTCAKRDGTVTKTLSGKRMAQLFYGEQKAEGFHGKSRVAEHISQINKGKTL